jgi:hypothetical protein
LFSKEKGMNQNSLSLQLSVSSQKYCIKEKSKCNYKIELKLQFSVERKKKEIATSQKKHRFSLLIKKDKRKPSSYF